MEKKKHLKALFCLSCLIAVLLSACVNQINEEGEKEGDIPISFSATVNRTASTRVTDTSFENGDRIGLFATLAGEALDTRRYIDNLRLDYQSTLIPERTVFYPVGNAALDFIAYYPYQKEGVREGSSCLSISVQTDQSIPENHSASDFLVATKEDVSSSNETVSLAFRHCLSKLKITLVPEEGEDLEAILASSPKVVASGFATKADYNLAGNNIVATSEPADIIASGEWREENGTLVGKEFIVIPQQISAGQQSVIFEWNGEIYTCPIADVKLEGNTQLVVKIAVSQTNHTLAGIVGEVEDWGETTTQEDGRGELQTHEIHVAAFTFKDSNIYRIYHQGKAVAEVCKEYLSAENAPVAAQAIVVYPVTDGQADLTQGTVLQLCGESRNLHGGKVAWNMETNTLAYTAGTSAPIEKFSISENGQIITSDSGEETVDVTIGKNVLRDARKDKVETYALVKIGTQYWMREELRATCFQDGTAIERQTEFTENSSNGYYKPDGLDCYFYNGETLLQGDIAPQGWRVPHTDDWKKLQTYLKDDTSLLKTGTWRLFAENGEGAPSTLPTSNLTGFDAYPVDMWRKEGYLASHYMVGYWTLDGTADELAIPGQTVFLVADSGGFTFADTKSKDRNGLKVISIRCVKE